MHIVIASQYWLPENGVPQRRWAWLTQELTAAGHEVTVIAPPPHYDRTEKSTHTGISKVEIGRNGERILRCQYLPTGNGLISRALGQASIAGFMLTRALGPRGLRQLPRPDVIIGTVPAIPTAFITHLIAIATCTPYIIDLRDAWPDLLKQARRWNEATGSTSWREKLLNSGPMFIIERAVRVAMYSTLRNATAVMVTSEWLGRSLANNPHLQPGNGVKKPLNGQVTKLLAHAPAKITNLLSKPHTALPPVAHADKYVLVRNVFPASIPRIEPKAELDQTTPDALHVLYAGTVGRAQQLTNVIDALEICEKRGLPVRLRVVGEGAALDYLKTYSQNVLGSAKHTGVEFVPRVRAQEMGPHYEWADTALVHLTDWEPLQRAVPSKTFELLELGIPISAAIAGETAHIIAEAQAGFVAAPLDPAGLANGWEEMLAQRNASDENPEDGNTTDENAKDDDNKVDLTVAKRWLANERAATLQRFHQLFPLDP